VFQPRVEAIWNPPNSERSVSEREMRRILRAVHGPWKTDSIRVRFYARGSKIVLCPPPPF